MKIANFFAALLAVVFIFTANSVYAADSKFENLLKNPGIAEQMKASYAGKNTSGSEQDTPLVKQAKAFALRINPPPPPPPPPQVNQTPATQAEIRPKVEVSAKFKLIGTSYQVSNDAQSWALIDEVGKGVHWVKQGTKVGYSDIEKIGDGRILINDGGRRYELKADRDDKPNFVKSYTGIIEEKKPIILLQPSESAPPAPTAIPAVNIENSPAQTSQPVVQQEVVLSPKEQLKSTKESIEWLKKIQSEPNLAGMSEGEANGLGDLGNFLQTLENQAKQQQAAIEANSPKVKDQKPQEKPQNIEKKQENHSQNKPQQVQKVPQVPQSQPTQPTQKSSSPHLRKISLL